jgi:transcription elongation factor Elf1
MALIEKVLHVILPDPVIEQHEAEWMTELRSRFKTFDKVAFQCPACGHVQKVADVEKKGKSGDRVYQECLNCQLTIFQMDGGRRVITKEGDVYHLFDFAQINEEGEL